MDVIDAIDEIGTNVELLKDAVEGVSFSISKVFSPDNSPSVLIGIEQDLDDIRLGIHSICDKLDETNKQISEVSGQLYDLCEAQWSANCISIDANNLQKTSLILQYGKERVDKVLKEFLKAHIP
jgi:flagellar capping protein FliD